jgi:hypothetical protein
VQRVASCVSDGPVKPLHVGSPLGERFVAVVIALHLGPWQLTRPAEFGALALEVVVPISDPCRQHAVAVADGRVVSPHFARDAKCAHEAGQHGADCAADDRCNAGVHDRSVAEVPD